MPVPPFRDVSVGQLLTRLAAALPDHPALVYGDRNLRFTFRELETEARLIACGLLGIGVRRGDRVAVWATNVPEWVILQFALAKIGAILVTVNTSLRAREIEYLLRQSETSTLFTIGGFRDVDYIEQLRAAGAIGGERSAFAPGETSELRRDYAVAASGRGGESARLPHLQRTIFIGEACPRDVGSYHQLRDLARSVADSELEKCELEVDVDDVINMQYTSGTTGFPKGVMLSSRNIVNNGYWIGRGLGYTPDDRLCLCVPLFHCFGCVLGVLAAYTHGAGLYPVESFDALRVLETVDRECCTALYGVPTMFLAELDHPQFADFDTTSLRTGIMAGALCPEPLMRRVIDQMKMRELTIVYGLTETSPGLTQTPRTADLVERTQTVGRVLPEVEVRIVDPRTGAQRSPGVDGELWAKGYVVMKGYYKMPEATAATITADGWLKTGDQASIDADGRVRITGRIKDVIIRGGENIAPKEVEDVLRNHPAIADASVYAVRSEFFGEEVAAALRLKPGAIMDAEDVQAFCRERLARFKVPRFIRVVDAFPLTASGKIQKFRLREQHESSLQPAQH